MVTLTAFLFLSVRLLNSSEVDVIVILDNPFPAINEHLLFGVTNKPYIAWGKTDDIAGRNVSVHVDLIVSDRMSIKTMHYISNIRKHFDSSLLSKILFSTKLLLDYISLFSNVLKISHYFRKKHFNWRRMCQYWESS